MLGLCVPEYLYLHVSARCHTLGTLRSSGTRRTVLSRDIFPYSRTCQYDVQLEPVVIKEGLEGEKSGIESEIHAESLVVHVRGQNEDRFCLPGSLSFYVRNH